MTQHVHGLDDRIGYAVKRLQQALRVAVDNALTTADLTLAQFGALKVLVELGPLSYSQLARRCFTARQSIQDVTRGLEAKALIIRVGGSDDGRIQRVQATARGRRAAKLAMESVERIEAAMTNGLTRAEEQQFLRWVNLCADNLTSSDKD